MTPADEGTTNAAGRRHGGPRPTAAPRSRSPRSALPRLLSFDVIAEETTVPATTWRERVANGELAAVRIGRSVRVDERDLLAWIASHREIGA